MEENNKKCPTENIDWKVRLLHEHRELQERIDKLRLFLTKSDMSDETEKAYLACRPSKYDLGLMREQLEAMTAYRDILVRRLISAGIL